MRLGSALPPVARITGPTNQPIRLSLPALKLSTSAGAAVKMRISRSELKYGDLRPYNPVFALAVNGGVKVGHWAAQNQASWTPRKTLACGAAI